MKQNQYFTSHFTVTRFPNLRPTFAAPARPPSSSHSPPLQLCVIMHMPDWLTSVAVADGKARSCTAVGKKLDCSQRKEVIIRNSPPPTHLQTSSTYLADL